MGELTEEQKIEIIFMKVQELESRLKFLENMKKEISHEELKDTMLLKLYEGFDELGFKAPVTINFNIKIIWANNKTINIVKDK